MPGFDPFVGGSWRLWAEVGVVVVGVGGDPDAVEIEEVVDLVLAFFEGWEEGSQICDFFFPVVR